MNNKEKTYNEMFDCFDNDLSRLGARVKRFASYKNWVEIICDTRARRAVKVLMCEKHGWALYKEFSFNEKSIIRFYYRR